MSQQIKRIQVDGKRYDVYFNDHRGFYYTMVGDDIVILGANWDELGTLREEMEWDLQHYLSKQSQVA